MHTTSFSLTDLPLLARQQFDRLRVGERMVSASRQGPAVDDQMQALVTLLTAEQPGQPARRYVGTTSTARGEGVTTVASRLACTAAATLAQPVLLIQTQHTGPSAAPQTLGFRDAIRGGDPSQCLRETSVEHLFVMGPGQPATLSSARPTSGGMRRLQAILGETFRLVIVDLPIVSELNTHFPQVAALDGVLLVIEAERLRRQVVLHAKEQLLRMQVSLLGVALNKRQMHIPDWLYRRM